MAGLESSLAAAEVAPISGLQFKLPVVADYVTSRYEVTFVPSGNTFAPSGVRTLRVNASGNGFADLSTAVLEFTVTEGNVGALKPLSANGSCFFSELRIRASGVELERIGGSSCSYGRIHEMLSRGLPASKRVDEASIAFGVKTGSLAGAAVTAAEYNELQALAKGGIFDSNTLAQNTSLVVFHKLFCGLAAQSLYMPLWALTGTGLISLQLTCKR